MPAPIGNTNAARRESGVGMLTADRVRSIKRALRNGDTREQVALRFGISRAVVKSIALGDSWSWV